MSTPADIIRQFLIDQGLAGFHYSLASVGLVDAGHDYAPADGIFLAGGTYVGQAAEIIVTGSTGGVLDDVEIIPGSSQGDYSIVPENPVAQLETSGSGADATFNATWTKVGWAAPFVSFLPDDPENAICIYDTAGKIDGRIMQNGDQIEHPGIQVRVRGPVYPDVWNKAEAIALAFDAQKRVVVHVGPSNTKVVLNISRTGAIVPMGIEQVGDRRRHNFTINAMVTIQKG